MKLDQSVVFVEEQAGTFTFSQKQEATSESAKAQKDALKKLAKENSNLISVTSHFVQREREREKKAVC